MSLLRAHGHVDADQYPIGLVQDEARLITERVNREMASAIAAQFAVVQATPNAVIKDSSTKRAIDNLSKMITTMTGPH